uniref:Kinesin motor domain-containing protein n=1 Tax=Clastoptera arizonana TaxID=38151 RepID=A0A1B6C5W6_9HEMI
MVLNRKDLEKAFSPKMKSRNARSTLGRHRLNSLSVDVEQPATGVKAFIRVRPFTEQELLRNESHKCILKVLGDKMLVFDPKEDNDVFFFHGKKQNTRDITKKVNKEIKFFFDYVFHQKSTNLEVFQATTKDMIPALLEGYNCSVFVYGATGAGKTHTMLGNDENPGITYLMMLDLHKQMEEINETKEFEVFVTYLEVYNENVYNLLEPSSTPMHLRDNGCSVTVAGLKPKPIKCVTDLLDLLRFGNNNRTQHPTDANAESSRSHAVFQVYVKMTSKENGEIKFVKLSMIDLAGSEKGMATGCSGSRFKEGSNINKSLLALGNCINSLAGGLKHIPYRDSKLTRLLKDSLGGNCLTVMIANVSPSSSSYDDTYNTLKYASRAKDIKSKLSQNIFSKKEDISFYVTKIEEIMKENAKLKSKCKELELAANEKSTLFSAEKSDQFDKMMSLCEEKKNLQSELMKLESLEKTLQWRIREQRFKAVQLDSIKNNEDDDKEVVERVQQSLKQLEARLKSVQEKIVDTIKTHKKHKQQFNQFSENIPKNLEKDFKVHNLKVEMSLKEIEESHHQKIIRMQDKRLISIYSHNTTAMDLMHRFYLLVKGKNYLTDALDCEYQNIVRMIKGVKGISWWDEDDEESESEEVCTISSTRVQPFMNLSILNRQSIKIQKEEENSPPTNSSPNTTFSLPTQDSISPGVAQPLKVPVIPNFEYRPPTTTSMPLNKVYSVQNKKLKYPSKKSYISRPLTTPFTKMSKTVSSMAPNSLEPRGRGNS